MAEFAELVPLSELRQKPEIKAGDTLVICKKGAFSGKEAEVINIGGKRVDVSVQGMGMTMKLNELALPLKSSSPQSKKRKTMKEDSGPKLSKMARQALAQELEVGGGGSSGQRQQKGGPVMRLKSNTVDVLGCNFEEARRKCENKFSRTMMSKDPIVFILHGHGAKGILKQKIRDWLKRDKQWVQKWSSADASDGGDAFTKVELKKIQY